MDKNSCTVIIAMECSEKERCGVTFRSVISSLRVRHLNEVKLEFKLCVHLCAFPSGFSDAYWKFLSGMNQDEVAVAIKEDHCILEYGYRQFRKNEYVISQHQYIRQTERAWQTGTGSKKVDTCEDYQRTHKA